MATASAPTARRLRNRLFRYDARIAVNALRGSLAGWHDRGLAALLLVAIAGGIRAGFDGRPWRVLAGTGLVAGAMLGLRSARSIRARLAHHATDGPLAADALNAATRWRYVAHRHAVVLAGAVIGAALAGAAMVPALLIGFLAGAAAGHAIGDIAAPGRAGRGARARTVQALLTRPVAGVVTAIVLLGLSAVAGAGSTRPAMVSAIVAAATSLAAWALTRVDDATIRFLTAAGWGVVRIVAVQGRPMLAFVLIAVPGGAIAQGWIGAGIVAAIACAAMLVMTLRILAYRLHGPRLADMLVAVLVAILVLTTLAVPVALPVAAAAMLWNLGRRAAARTWLLA